MCKTIRYLYLCSHPATYRFRTALCSTPNRRKCRVRDDSLILPYACSRCEARNKTRAGRAWANLTRRCRDVEAEAKEQIWYVPSRCFVDVGFRTLNPFETGVDEIDPCSSPRRPPLSAGIVSPLSELAMVAQLGMRDVAGRGRLCAMAAHDKRQPSPCCLRERKMGAFKATRLEGSEYRIRGKIIDSFCKSSL